MSTQGSKRRSTPTWLIVLVAILIAIAFEFVRQNVDWKGRGTDAARVVQNEKRKADLQVRLDAIELKKQTGTDVHDELVAELSQASEEAARLGDMVDAGELREWRAILVSNRDMVRARKRFEEAYSAATSGLYTSAMTRSDLDAKLQRVRGALDALDALDRTAEEFPALFIDQMKMAAVPEAKIEESMKKLNLDRGKAARILDRSVLRTKQTQVEHMITHLGKWQVGSDNIIRFDEDAALNEFSRITNQLVKTADERDRLFDADAPAKPPVANAEQPGFNFAEKARAFVEQSEQLHQREWAGEAVTAEQQRLFSQFLGDAEQAGKEKGSKNTQAFVLAMRTIEPPYKAYGEALHKVTEAGVPNIEALKSKDDIPPQLELIRKLAEANEQMDAAYKALPDRFRAELEKLDLPAAEVQRLMATSSAEPFFKLTAQIRQLDRDLFAAWTAQLNMLGEHWGKWTFENETLDFQDDELNNKYNRHTDIIDKACNDQERLQKEIFDIAKSRYRK